MNPRCARVMHPYEAVWGALLDDVLCGRPQGHNGQCRSFQAIRREVERSRQNWPRYRALRRQRRVQARELLLRRQLFEAVEDAARQARDRELATRAVSW